MTIGPWQYDIIDAYGETKHKYTYLLIFNFDALAQGNAYKPTKEPINYRGPGGDRTHDAQTYTQMKKKNRNRARRPTRWKQND